MAVTSWHCINFWQLGGCPVRMGRARPSVLPSYEMLMTEQFLADFCPRRPSNEALRGFCPTTAHARNPRKVLLKMSFGPKLWPVTQKCSKRNVLDAISCGFGRVSISRRLFLCDTRKTHVCSNGDGHLAASGSKIEDQSA